jgi:hypothetical protein
MLDAVNLNKGIQQKRGRTDIDFTESKEALNYERKHPNGLAFLDIKL